MEQKKEPTFEFKKLSENQYEFIMTNDDFTRTELTNKQFVKDHYKELVSQKAEIMANLGAVNKQLEINKIEKDDELQHFIELANKAAVYKKFMDSEKNQKSYIEMLEKINESMKRIEIVIPEVKRMTDK